MLKSGKRLLTRSLSVLNLMALPAAAVAAAPPSPDLLAAESSQAPTEPVTDKNSSAAPSLEPEEASEPSVCEKCSKPMKVFFFQDGLRAEDPRWVCSACVSDSQPAIKKARFKPIDRDDEREHEDMEVELLKARSLAEETQKELAKLKLELFHQRRQHKMDAENAKSIISVLEQKVDTREKERDAALKAVAHRENLVEKATGIISELTKAVQKAELTPVICNSCKHVVYGAQGISFCGDCRSFKEIEEEKQAKKDRVKAVGLIKRDITSQWQALKEQVEQRLNTVFYEMAGEEV